ncbi:hypothetical protein [Variovorax guangxiensis]|uniref:hypothetical protein n=1 Tax=Variovorax guangxiensis TaxID=1775474 RepID=UPI0028641314|nr:hypothetical protein [Variovorax guangxiensis]MDR6857881.1 hypothetical protein [Variovorax guangxiensis]
MENAIERQSEAIHDSTRDAVLAAADRATARLRLGHATLFPHQDPGRFDTDYLAPLARSNTGHTRWEGAAVAQALNLTTTTDGVPLDASLREAAVRIVIFRTACANVVQAQKFATEHSDHAWTFMERAAYWEGVLAGRMSVVSTAGRSARANEVRYKDHAKAREFAQQQWTAHAAEYKSKQDFAAILKGRIRHEFDVKVTERTICEDWLKGFPAPSRLAGS